MNWKRSVGLSLCLAATFVLTSCCDQGMKSRIEDFLEELEDADGATIKYDDKCTTLKDFKYRKYDDTRFRADEIKFSAFAYDDGFEELEMRMTEAKGELGVLDLPDFPYFIALDPGNSRYDFEIDYRLDGDEMKIEKMVMTVEDEFEMRLRSVLIEDGDELLLKSYEVSLKVDKEFRRDAEEQLDWIDDMMRHIEDDLDEKDAKKACKKIREFCKDPKSIKLTLEPKKPRDVRGMGLADLDDLVEDFNLKVK